MGFVCGKTGSGKGMFTKTEMTGTIFSNPTDEIYVIDRAGEYTAIAERYGGSTYHFGVGTGTHLNPFDTVSVEHMTRNEQIAFKVDAMLAQAALPLPKPGRTSLRLTSHSYSAAPSLPSRRPQSAETIFRRPYRTSTMPRTSSRRSRHRSSHSVTSAS